MFNDTVAAPGVSKYVLYRRIKEWFKDNSTTENSELKMSNPDSGRLVGKCNFTKRCTITDSSGVKHQLDFRIKYTVFVQIKDNVSYITLWGFWATINGDDHMGADITSMYQAIKDFQSKKMSEMDKQNSQCLIDVLDETNTRATGVLASIKKATNKN